MAVSLRRRGTGVLALAMAGGLSLAAAAPAGAAANDAPAYYQGVTSANVLSVALNLPIALPGVPQHLAVNLIGVTGKATHNTLATVNAKTASLSTATLASGNLTDQLGLSKTIKASLDGAQSAASDGLSIPASQTQGLLSLNVGPLRAKVGQMANNASAELLDADVLNLGALLGAKTNGATTSLIKTVQDNVNAIQSQVQSTLNNVVSQVNSAVNTVAPNSPASQTLDQVQAAVQTVQSKVNTVLNQILNTGNTSVLKVQTLTAGQNIAPAGSAAKATADTVLANLDLLSGLVTVKGFESHAMAIANGNGAATATYSGHKPIVAVGTPVLAAALDENGLSISNVAGLPSSVSDTVNGALAQLQSVLNTVLGTLGVSLNYVPGHVDKIDRVGGKYAAATGPEYDITVANPTDHTQAIAVVGLGHGTTASVSAAHATRHVQVSNPQEGKLPHTGANLPIIAGGGLAFLLGAAYLRRRVTA